MQPAVDELVKIGQFPSEKDAEVDLLKRIQNLLERIEQPVDDDEARALATLFGPDDCFGLAWALLHAVETAPGWPLQDVLSGARNEWIDILRQSCANKQRWEG
jgi:hypothetical protein